MKTLRLWLLLPLVSSLHVWNYDQEVPTTPAGFGRRVERSTFSDIFETLSRGKSLDFALERALSVTPRSKVGQKSVRFPEPEPSPFTTPRPAQSASPTPQSFSEIFQPRPPLVLKEHSNDQLRRLTTTKRFGEELELGTESVALTTLRAILDHVRKKDKVSQEEESQYDYEYVYDYVEVEEATKFSPPAESNVVTGKFPTRRRDDGRKSRPKIVPKQRVVPPPPTERKQTGFVSFVTPRTNQAVTRYDKASDTLEIVNPPILVYTEEEEEEEELSTRRVGYTYKQPDNKIDISPQSGSSYREPLPEEPLTPSLQSVYESPVTQSTFTNLISGPGVTYNEQPPEQPLTPSLQAAYEPPTSSRPSNSNRKVKFGYKYSGPQVSPSHCSAGNINCNSQPQEVLMAPATVQQPPSSYNAPSGQEEQPPPSTYSGPPVTERPPRTSTTTRRTTILAEQPPPATYAPTFLNEELPPYQAEDSLASYDQADNLPSYEETQPSVFVTPTPPAIVIPPKTMPGRPSIGPRSNEQQQRFAFSTLLPPIKSLRFSTPTTVPPSQRLESFSDIFSPGKTSAEQKTSYRNNAPPPHFVAFNDEQEEEGGRPVSNSHSEPPLQTELTPPSDRNIPDYDDYTDLSVTAGDPRLSSAQSVANSPTIELGQKLQKFKETPSIRRENVNRFVTHDNGSENDFDQTTRIKGILKQEAKPFGRLTTENSPPPSLQFSEGYSAPIPDQNTPSVFSEILEPPQTTTSSSNYVAPIDIDDYQSPPRRPDTSYSVSVEPTITDNNAVNGHAGSLKIDINVNIKKDGPARPSSNSHGPVQTTQYRPQSDLPTTQSYARPADTEYVGPTTSTTTNYQPTPSVFSDILQPPDGEDSEAVTEDYQQPTKQQNRNKHKKKKKGPESGYPRNYGSKLNDERPNDIVAPDYNIDLYKDDFTAPDVADIPSAPVVGDYYNAPVVEDYTGPASYDYEENYFGHEAPGYQEFIDDYEADYYTEKPKHKHKKVKPFVDFGKHQSNHRKPKHKFKHQKSKYRPVEPVHDEHYFNEDFFESEPHLEKPNYQEETFYEPLQKPHYQEDSFYEPLEKPVFEPDPYYDEPFDDYQLKKPHYQEDSFYEPLEKPVYQPEPYYEEPFDDYQDNLYIDPVPKGYYDQTTELIPELQDVIRPLDWNVHDFSSWRRILDSSRFGGSLSNTRGHGDKHFTYSQPEISNEIIHDDYEDYGGGGGLSYTPGSYDEPLYYEDYYHDYDNYVDFEDQEISSPYSPHLSDFETYEPRYQPEPRGPLVLPEPFHIPFDAWLDSSGVGAWGLPSVRHSTYATPPAYQTFSHIGSREHREDREDQNNNNWIPSEKPPVYRPSYLARQRPAEVEPGPVVVRELYSPPSPPSPPPWVEYRRVTPRLATSSSSPGSLWTGLASFAGSLEERNHYRGHSVGMVSLGSSEAEDMILMGSENKFAVMVRPPTGFNVTTEVRVSSSTGVPPAGVGNRNDGGLKTPSGGAMLDNTDPGPGSVSAREITDNNQDNQTRSGSQSALKAGHNIPADFEHYILHSSLIGSTLSKMSKLLETYT